MTSIHKLKQIITVNLPKPLIAFLDRCVDAGLAESRSELVRIVIVKGLDHLLKRPTIQAMLQIELWKGDQTELGVIQIDTLEQIVTQANNGYLDKLNDRGVEPYAIRKKGPMKVSKK